MILKYPPPTVVNPARYFHQIGESMPAMKAANAHILERIQQLRLNPPTMDQDVSLVPGGRPFEPYLCIPVGDGDDSEESRTMGDYSARCNPQSVSHAAMQGSVRVIGGRLTLPYDHPPHSSLGAALEEELPETLCGIPRDLEPYNQTVIGTNTFTIQTLETSRILRTQITQLAAASDIFEEFYRLLNRLQATTQQLAEARPSPEYARAVWRNRRWDQRYHEFLTKPPGVPWAFAGPPPCPRSPSLFPTTSHPVLLSH